MIVETNKSYFIQFNTDFLMNPGQSGSNVTLNASGGSVWFTGDDLNNTKIYTRLNPGGVKFYLFVPNTTADTIVQITTDETQATSWKIDPNAGTFGPSNDEKICKKDGVNVKLGGGTEGATWTTAKLVFNIGDIFAIQDNSGNQLICDTSGNLSIGVNPSSNSQSSWFIGGVEDAYTLNCQPGSNTDPNFFLCGNGTLDADLDTTSNLNIWKADNDGAFYLVNTDPKLFANPDNSTSKPKQKTTSQTWSWIKKLTKDSGWGKF